MSKPMIVFLAAAALLAAAAAPIAWAGCDPYGVSTLRGDAQYPPGWITSYGVIEISPPDEFIYAVTDGAAPVQQFTRIKARLRNRISDHAMGAGSVTALARYRLRTDYQPDLSADPPGAQSMQPHFSLSTAAPVAVSALGSETPEPFSFDFSAQPIPAGITDLYFMVMFQGQIQDVEGTATAIGMTDLNEPHHIAAWNNTDWFLVNYQLLTGADIRATPELIDYVIDNCWYLEPYVDPMDMEISIGFTASDSDTPVYSVHYQNIAPGRYGRIIFLSDAQAFWMSVQSVTYSPNDTLQWLWQLGAVTSQVDAAGFHPTAPKHYRGIAAHHLSAWIWTCPSTGYSAEIYDQVSSRPPADSQPVPVTSINFP